MTKIVQANAREPSAVSDLTPGPMQVGPRRAQRTSSDHVLSKPHKTSNQFYGIPIEDDRLLPGLRVGKQKQATLEVHMRPLEI